MDDTALVPNQPNLEPEEAEAQAIDDALIEEQKIARANSHPAWSAVEQYIDERIDDYRNLGAVDPSLSAAEYKVQALGRLFTANEFINLLDRIKHAVEATEPRSKPNVKK